MVLGIEDPWIWGCLCINHFIHFVMRSLRDCVLE